MHCNFDQLDIHEPFHPGVLVYFTVFQEDKKFTGVHLGSTE